MAWEDCSPLYMTCCLRTCCCICRCPLVSNTLQGPGYVPPRIEALVRVLVPIGKDTPLGT